MKKDKVFAFFVCLACFFVVSLSANAIQFRRYNNARFHFGCWVPTVLSQMSTSENNDGATFRRDSKTYLKVYGSYNAFDESIDGRFRSEVKSSDTYTLCKSNYFVRSGRSGRCIYYTKTVLRGEVFCTAYLCYPANEKWMFNGIVMYLFNNFPL